VQPLLLTLQTAINFRDIITRRYFFDTTFVFVYICSFISSAMNNRGLIVGKGRIKHSHVKARLLGKTIMNLMGQEEVGIRQLIRNRSKKL
jgi:hypothetical protein